jgi:hypothetical protein
MPYLWQAWKKRGQAMLLIIQIAAGIVLGFAIIAYREALLKSAKWILGFIAVLIIIALIIWIGGEVVETAEPYVGKFFGVAGKIVGGVCAFIFGILGGFFLIELSHELGWLKRKSSDNDDRYENLVFATGAANVLFVYIVTWPLLAFTPVGGWYEAVDQWSQSNGFTFGGSLAVTSFCWLWPGIPLWIHSRYKQKQTDNG